MGADATDDKGVLVQDRTGMPSYVDVVRTPGFLPTFVALSLSTWGDYIARICVALVVRERTGSDLAMAATFAVSLLPSILGRSLLSPLADRIPYKHVLVGSDVVRGALVVALMTAVGQDTHVAVLLALLFGLELFGGPAGAAHQILLTDLFPDRRQFMRARGISTLAEQVNQAIGLSVGGIVVTALSARGALLADLATFVVSATLYALAVRARAVSGVPSPGITGFFRDFGGGASYLFRNRVLVSLLALSLVAMLGVIAPEAVAIPYVLDHQLPEWLGGMLMAAPVVGAVVGIVVVGRWQPEVASARIIIMALLMPVPLVVTPLVPTTAEWLTVVWLLWFTSGALQAFMLPLQATFALVVSQELRGRVIGLAGAAAMGASAVCYLVAGWLSETFSPTAAVSICALVCFTGVAILARSWPRRALQSAVDHAFNEPTSEEER
ncbi:MFS transporter [Knoellia sp. CPCC 206450]|uniref:MFS transporter n=1 Tax=Knoellia tibetensis TaxID=3404798 RepID=UPI003B42F115